MMDDEVEAVARALARVRRAATPENPESDVETTEQHREMARLAIAALERHRAAKINRTVSSDGEPARLNRTTGE